MFSGYKHTLTTLLALAVTAALPGCATNGIGPADRITIDSEPRGAQVLVADKPIGVTPVVVALDDVFPMHWTSRTKKDDEGFAFYRRLDTLTIKQPGCDTYSALVDTNDLAHDIKIHLKCDPNYKPPVATPAQPAEASTLEQRLQRLDTLKQKGLISDAEYRAQRQRVLDEI
jgi:Short C-terminal domain